MLRTISITLSFMQISLAGPNSWARTESVSDLDRAQTACAKDLNSLSRNLRQAHEDRWKNFSSLDDSGKDTNKKGRSYAASTNFKQ